MIPDELVEQAHAPSFHDGSGDAGPRHIDVHP